MEINRVVIAGAGAGFWVTVGLCRELKGLVKIEVYDDDNFEGGNGFRRLPKPNDPKLAKVDALKIFVQFVMGDIPPIIHRRRLTSSEILEGDWTQTLLIDCTDMDVVSKETLFKTAKSSGAKYLRFALDGNGVATVSPGPPIALGGDNSSGYGITPNIGQTFRAAGQGVEAVLYLIQTGKVPEFQTFVPTPETQSIELDLTERNNSNGICDTDNSLLPNSETNSGDNRDQSQGDSQTSQGSEGQGRMAGSGTGD